MLNSKSLFFIISLVFFFGWSTQYLSILSITQTNYILIFLSAVYCYRFYNNFPGLIYGIWLFFILYILLCFLFIDSYYLIHTIAYLYYAIAMLLSIVVGFIVGIKVLEIPKFYYLLFLMLQLIFTSFQHSFTDVWLNSTLVNINFKDAVSGTFFLSSDASLVFFISSLLIVLRHQNPSNLFSFALLTISSIVVFLTNSTAGSVFFMLCLIYYVQHKWTEYFSPLKLFYIFLCFLTIFYIAPGLNEFFLKLLLDFYSIEIGRDAARLAPLGYLLYENFIFFGNGPLYYYNPISKDWLFNSGFSVLYSLYLDYGLVGLFLIYAFYLSLIFYCLGFSYLSMLYCSGLFLFTMFNFSLTDFSFNMAFAFSLSQIRRCRYV